MKLPNHQAGYRLCSQGAGRGGQGCGAEQGPCCAPEAVCHGRASATCQSPQSACLGSFPGCCREKLWVEEAPQQGQDRAGSCWCLGQDAHSSTAPPGHIRGDYCCSEMMVVDNSRGLSCLPRMGLLRQKIKSVVPNVVWAFLTLCFQVSLVRQDRNGNKALRSTEDFKFLSPQFL